MLPNPEQLLHLRLVGQSMSFKFLNEGQSGNIQQVTPIDTFIDPVSKIRVSNPSNLIDTDFEYGLQPTKWETVEIINNTPAFFSRSGDTTIPDITGIITSSGTREITVTTAFPHNLAVGIPIRVSGTKSLTADGSYIINATPSLTTFTYLAIAAQADTVSIFDLYTSIITGEFFQGSQITVDDAEGVTTSIDPNDSAISLLTVKTPTKHGFGLNTPFYFLNLNSTISQEFESQNAASLSFDPTNSATAQTFDGSNTLLQTPIDLSNSATTATVNNNIQSTDPTGATVTVSIDAANADKWAALKIGDPLYYSVNAGSGYFQSNPRGVVFIKNVDNFTRDNNDVVTVANFQVSQLPNGTALPIVGGMTGLFVTADRAKTFAGNNVDSETQIDLTVEVGTTFNFDGGNQGYVGESGQATAEIAKVFDYGNQIILVADDPGIPLNYYVGQMLQYTVEPPENDDAVAANNLVINESYFILTFDVGELQGSYVMTIAELPGGSAISPSGGTGIQRFRPIGVSVNKNIVHVKDSNFDENDMLEYTAPENGEFEYQTEELEGGGNAPQKRFFFVVTAYDSHNYELRDLLDDSFIPIVATGGDNVFQVWDNGRLYRIHEFTLTGTSDFIVSDTGNDNGKLEYLIVAGGGGGGSRYDGGGGAGGLLTNFLSDPLEISEGIFPVTVGAGGQGAPFGSGASGTQGQNSSVFGIVATGGGFGSTNGVPGGNGGSGGGGGGVTTLPNTPGGLGNTPATTPSQGNNGGEGTVSGTTYPGGGGGGAGSAGSAGSSGFGGNGGSGIFSYINGTRKAYAGGGGGGVFTTSNVGGIGGSGVGGKGSNNSDTRGDDGMANTGSGGGGGGLTTSGLAGSGGGAGGSGIVIIRYPLTAINDKIISASGGETSTIIENEKIYAVHQFKNVGSDSFVVTNAPEGSKLEYLVIAGGGGAGGSSGAPGGAGGYRTNVPGQLSGRNSAAEADLLAQVQSYSVVVGDGGLGWAPNVGSLQGQNSSFGGIVSLGGGRSSNSGGSGGGAGQSGSPGSGTAGQGFDGGAAGSSGGGGGGGAGANGTAGSGGVGGNGGSGISSNITGTAIIRAGGGGAGAGTTPGQGGAGGGGNGGVGGGGFHFGQANTGGGAGSPYTVVPDTPERAKGGSGIVIVRYEIGQPVTDSGIIEATGG